MSKKFGFTLAEVLITLGIIGVVAAMTIPTLMSNTNSAKFSSQFKKTLSTLSQAGLMATGQYDIDYSMVGGGCDSGGGTQSPDSYATMCAIFNATLSGARYEGAASNVKDGKGTAYSFTHSALPSNTTSNYVAYTLADGSLVAFQKDMATGSCTVPVGSTVETLLADTNGAKCIGFIDVNGATLPNKEVTCSGSGTTAKRTATNACGVTKDATHMTDIYPVVFHDGIVEPATNAAAAVLAGRTASGSS